MVAAGRKAGKDARLHFDGKTGQPADSEASTRDLS